MGSSARAWASTYYVATTGNDGNSCAAAQSSGMPKRTLVSAVGCLVAGDTLLVRGGTYAESLVNNVPSGTSWAAPVRIAAFPNETVWLSPGAVSKVIGFAYAQHYIEFDGINLDGSTILNSIVQIEGWSGGNAHHIRFRNLTMMGNPNRATQGVLLTAQVAGVIGGNEFINCIINNTGTNDFDHGIYVQSSNNLIDGCTIYNVPGAGVHIYNGNGQTMSGNIVRNSVIRDGRLTASGERGWGILSTTGSSGTKIYNNVVYNIRNSGSGSAGIYLGLSNAFGAEVYNNTVYGNSASGVRIDSPYSNAVVRNNISYQNAGGNYVNSGTNTTASNNMFSTNPVFIDISKRDFGLQATSPAIDAGMVITMVKDDIVHAPRPQGATYDIGAYEYGGSQASPPAAPTNVRVLSN